MNKLRLKSLQMNNFGIYKGTVDLDFEGKSIIGILAKYESDPNRSNRSGKSLIIESIKYLLTGITRGKKNIFMIHKGEKVMSVVGVFSDDNDKEYVISRGVDHKSKSSLSVNWTEKIKDGQEAIEELFGISKDDFDLTSFFAQADIHGFMNLGAADKTKFLMKWMDNEHWKEKHSKVMEDVKEYSNKLKENEILKKTLEASLEFDDDLKVILNNLKKDNEKLSSKKKELSNRAKEVGSELSDLKVQLNVVFNQRRQLDLALKDFNTNKDQIKKLQNSVISLQDKNKELKSSRIKIQPKESVLEGIAENKANMKALTISIEKMKENKGGMCPVINESCDRIVFSKEDINSINKELENATGHLKSYNALLNQHVIDEKIFDKIKYNDSEIKRDKAVIKSKAGGDSDFENKINEKIKGLPKLSGTDIKELQNQIDSIEYDIDEINESSMANAKKIGAYELRIEKARKALEKIDKVSERNEKLQNRLEDLKYVSLMFSNKGIPADEIDNAFQEVQQDINYILKKLDCGLTVSFTPDKELTAWDPACSCGFVYPKGYRKTVCESCESPRLKKRKEEMSLRVMENGEESDFEMDSGGGKTIISYAVRIALTMLKRRQNKAKLNILFLDEVDSALDSHLASTITDSITRILTKELGYDQILMVSHKEEIKNSVPNILEVTRYDTYSTARFM